MAISPPKPWERNVNDSTTTSSLPAGHPSLSSITTGVCPVSKASNISSKMSSTNPSPPELPPKPNTMITSTPSNNDLYSNTNGYPSSYGSAFNSNNPYASRYGSYGMTPAYGGFGNSSTYGGYSRLGGLGSYGAYGGSYAGGMGYGGYGGMGAFGGLNNPMGVNPHADPIMPPSFGQTLANSTQSTFQLLESLVMAFSGFSQLLESTFMMTHSSFFTFIQLIEQFNLFKFSIGKILSLFDLIKWLKGVITGEGSTDASGPFSAWSESFRRFDSSKGGTADPQSTNKAPRPSRKPIVIFFLTVFGIPYLMNKLIKSLTAKQELQNSSYSLMNNPNQVQQQQTTLSIDPSKLTFVKSIHAYRPTQNYDQTVMNEQELSFDQNEIIAVLLPTAKEERDQLGWWKGRSRDGRIGWFPKNYVEEIPIHTKTNSPTVNPSINNGTLSTKQSIILAEEQAAATEKIAQSKHSSEMA